MKLYLIRHGRTYANENRLYCGSTDLPLTQGGREALKELRYEIPGALFRTSGMLRTEQTLEALFGPVPHEADPRFREVDFGVFEMKSYEMLKDDPQYLQWITGDNERNIPPRGESGAQMTQRVLTALETLPDNTVLVTHGGVIAAIMASLFPEENKNRYQWQPKPGFGYAVADGQYREMPCGAAQYPEGLAPPGPQSI